MVRRILLIILASAMLMTPTEAKVTCLDCCGCAYQDSYQCCMLVPAITIGALIIGTTIVLLFINRTSSDHAHSE